VLVVRNRLSILCQNCVSGLIVVMQPATSIEHFQRAIAIDPESAPAYAGMADAQCMLFSAALQVVRPAKSLRWPGLRP
jgi:hypothetical protein